MLHLQSLYEYADTIYDYGLKGLKMICLNTPGCKAFNTDGWLKNGTAASVGNQPCDLYTMVPGPAPAKHFFKIPNWDVSDTLSFPIHFVFRSLEEH